MSLDALETSISDRSSRTAVIGLGYVGLPLAVEIAKASFPVTGYDVSQDKVASIEALSIDPGMVDGEKLRSLLSSGRIRITSDKSSLDDIQIFIICVPTPLTENQNPDLTYIEESIAVVAENISPGAMVVLESTAYPGCTRDLVLSTLEKGTALKAGEDLAVAFSPERVDPGDSDFHISNVPKLVSGATERCLGLASAFYSEFIDEVVAVDSPEIAEMAKLLENIYRSVNIALVNELALICDRMDINVWQVIDAASTKPFGFSSFKPGPGLGGHCIPVDPFYLSWKAKEVGIATEFIELAGRINQYMPHYVVEKIAEALNHDKKSVKGSSIGLLGVTYKANVADLRASPAITVFELLLNLGAEVWYHDPHVPVIELNGTVTASVDFTKDNLNAADCIVTLAAHDAIDWDMLNLLDCPIVDTRNVIGARDRVFTI